MFGKRGKDMLFWTKKKCACKCFVFHKVCNSPINWAITWICKYAFKVFPHRPNSSFPALGDVMLDAYSLLFCAPNCVKTKDHYLNKQRKKWVATRYLFDWVEMEFSQFRGRHNRNGVLLGSLIFDWFETRVLRWWVPTQVAIFDWLVDQFFQWEKLGHAQFMCLLRVVTPFSTGSFRLFCVQAVTTLRSNVKWYFHEKESKGRCA